MNLVLVVQEKNIKSVEVYYKKINIEVKIIIINKINIDFFDSKISKILFSGAFNEPRSVSLETKPLFLPIFRNLFFLLLKISSPDIDLK